jgi:hypothetical protein
MSLRWLCRGAVVATLLLTGCGFGKRANPDEVPEDNTTRLSETVSVDVSAWLSKPRAELAKLCAEADAEAQDRVAALRDGKATGALLPGLLVVVQAPVFRQAEYRKGLGFSVPAHVKGDKPDAPAALHLARYGDHEAALKLADDQTRKGVDALKLSRNYPVEWTRLVGLTLTDAELRLAAGDPEGAAVLVRVHEQLSKLLDAKTKASPLGTVLLGQGRRALQKAARAWRDPSIKKTGLAEDCETALAAWGDVAPQRLPGLDAAQLAAVFGKPGKAHSASGKALDRAADLLGLPFPAEGLLAVGAFADADGTLASVQLAYRPGIAEKYPRPEDLGLWLEERSLLPAKEQKFGALMRQEFVGLGLSAEVFRTNNSSTLGALVTLNAPKAEPAPGPRDHRSFGPAHLDLPYSVARDLAAPTQVKPTLTLRDKKQLASLADGLDVPALANAVLQRNPDADLIARARLTWSREAGADEGGRLLAGLWSAYGRGKVYAASAKGDGLVLQWEAPSTRTQFLAPSDGTGPVLTAMDIQPDKGLAARQKAALARAASERKARLAAGKADSRLEAGPETINGLILKGLSVGSTKDEAEAALALLPDGTSHRQTKLPDGRSVAILTEHSAGAAFWARQVLVRYDGDKVAEVRVRYSEGLAAVKKGETLEARLTGDERQGTGEVIAGTWVGLWTDVSARKPIMRRWRDDRIIRTYQRDATGSEVVWRARPEDDGPSKPWYFVSRGPQGVSLGQPREKVIKALGKPVALDGEAEWFRMPVGSPYEMVLVEWEGGRASRIQAVERQTVRTQAADALKALQRSWGRDLPRLGYFRRHEDAHGPILGSMYWHDDGIRVWTCVQDESTKARVLTEWRTWPLPPPKPVAKKPEPPEDMAEDIG